MLRPSGYMNLNRIHAPQLHLSSTVTIGNQGNEVQPKVLTAHKLIAYL